MRASVRAEKHGYKCLGFIVKESFLRNRTRKMIELNSASLSTESVGAPQAAGWCTAGMVVLVCCVVVVVAMQKTWCHLVYYRKKDPSCMAPLPPGSMGWPLFGESLDFIRTNKDKNFYDKRSKKYGPIYASHLFGNPVIRVTGANLVRELMSKETKYMEMHTILGITKLIGQQSILFADGDKHQTMRKHYQNAFGRDALEAYVTGFDTLIKSYLAELCAKGQQPHHKKSMTTMSAGASAGVSADVLASRAVPLFDEMRKLACQAVGRILLGMNNGQQQQEFYELSMMFTYALFSLPLPIPGSAYKRALDSKEKLNAFFAKYPQLGSDSVLAWLINSHTGDSELDKGTIMRELLFTGQITLSALATTVITVLYHHPDVTAKLVSSIADNTDTSADDLSLECIEKMAYLDWVIKEVLRLHPPAGGCFRKAKETFVIGGYQIPKGCTVSISIADSQRTSTTSTSNESCVEHQHQERDLQKFRPERWDFACLQDVSSRAHKPYYIPFGYGRRSCLGKSYALLFIKVFTVRLLQMCDVEMLEHQPGEEVKMSYLPVNRPAGQLLTVFTDKNCRLTANKLEELTDTDSDDSGNSTSAGG